MERKWKRLRIERWRPKAGDELEGIYRGTIAKKGRFGTYTAHVIHTDDGGVYHVSGSSADELMEMLPPPIRVRLVCEAIRTYTAEDGEDSKQYRVYAAYIEDKSSDSADRSSS